LWSAALRPLAPMGSRESTQSTLSFSKIIQILQDHYGPPLPPISTDPFELIIWENVAYLANDRRRASAFAELKARVGVKPKAILETDQRTLADIAKVGILADLGAEKLLTIAKVAYEEFNGDLQSALRLPLRQAKNALKKFPGIGEPGAEKILLFTGTCPILALESNGLRVLLRLGYGKQDRNYAASYRSVQAAVAGELPSDCASLICAYQLLRTHGQQLCKSSKPHCESCPLKRKCLYFLSNTSRANPKGYSHG
jgi:endonuclease III